MLNVKNEWEPLREIIVGRNYPPEIYDSIDNPDVRETFTELAVSTENTIEKFCTFLDSFGVRVHRPEIPKTMLYPDGNYNRPPYLKPFIPPYQPRNIMFMLNNTLYFENTYWPTYYNNIKDDRWPQFKTYDEFCKTAPEYIIDELYTDFNLEKELPFILEKETFYENIKHYVKKQNNNIIHEDWVDGGMIFRADNNLFFGSPATPEEKNYYIEYTKKFKDYNCSYINSEGHLDGIMSILDEGLALVWDDPSVSVNWDNIFPKDWEILKVNKGQEKEKSKFYSIEKSSKKWYIPGLEKNHQVVKYINEKFHRFTGEADESFFDINLLIIDNKNIVMTRYNEKIINLLEKRGINCHVFEIPYQEFWDGGIHCMTVEIDRG
jgi:hypothetical protein